MSDATTFRRSLGHKLRKGYWHNLSSLRDTHKTPFFRRVKAVYDYWYWFDTVGDVWSKTKYRRARTSIGSWQQALSVAYGTFDEQVAHQDHPYFYENCKHTFSDANKWPHYWEYAGSVEGPWRSFEICGKYI